MHNEVCRLKSPSETNTMLLTQFFRQKVIIIALTATVDKGSTSSLTGIVEIACQSRLAQAWLWRLRTCTYK